MATKRKHSNDELIAAEETFRVDVQYAIQKLMKLKGVSQHELAERLGVGDSRVSQMLSFKGNLTVRQVGRVFAALDESARISCDTLLMHDLSRMPQRLSYISKTVDSLLSGPMEVPKNVVSILRHTPLPDGQDVYARPPSNTVPVHSDEVTSGAA